MYVGLVDLRVAGNHTQWFEVNKVVLHHTFELYHPVGGDIALVQLKSPIVFSDSVLPVCIAPPNVNLQNVSCWATGWGLISQKGKRTKWRVIPFTGACRRDGGFLAGTTGKKMFCQLQDCRYLGTEIPTHQSLSISECEILFYPWLALLYRKK